MANVHTNREDRIKDMQDEVSSIFYGREDEIKELEPEDLRRIEATDEWCDMSEKERKLMRDIGDE